MKLIQRFLLALALIAGAAVVPARAGDTTALFINLTTDDPQRAGVGLTFGLHQQEAGHPLTLFLNERGVLLASRQHADRLAGLQQLLTQLLSRGATVLVVPASMKQHGLGEADLLPGVQLSNRQRSGEALFRNDTRTLSW